MAQLVVPLMQKLADITLQELQEQIFLVVEVKDEAKKLYINLTAIRKMLCGVEIRRMKEDDQAVDFWLDELKELTYEMDDVLDQWITENSKLEIEASKKVSIWQKVRSLSLSICFYVKKVSMCHDIAGKIKELSNSVDRILTQAKVFEFALTDNRDSSISERNNRPVEISILNESEVCGRESDESRIISRLLNPKNNREHLGHVVVVSIVGVGGIGKTTLVKKIFNDDQVKFHFEHVIWVPVSNPFEERRIAKAILQGIGTDDAADEQEALFNRNRISLSGKKFLLILDDVWTEDHAQWTRFRDVLKEGAPDSRILVTTRNEYVALTLGSSFLHKLSTINNQDAWLILSRNAFSQGSKALAVRQKVQRIGWKIALKCQGLPLAASCMGNLLKFKSTVQQWEEVLGSEIWELKKASEGIFAHLYLSYKDLDPETKRCFSYCAVFPKGSTLVVEQLIRLWVAQGFLSPSGNSEKLESRGRECFDNLAMRSFFQDFEKDAEEEGQITSCKIHDIIHDFATFLAEKECCVLQKADDKDDEDDQGMFWYREMAAASEKVRHLAMASGKVRHLSLLSSPDEVNLTVTDCRRLRSIFSSRHIPTKLFTSMHSIRALSLQDCGLQQLPKKVGSFIHLRYMDLSLNPLTELPKEISHLYNLETLDIKSCRNLIKLPSSIGQLVKLRYLINSQTESLRELPQEFETLISLRTVSELRVGQGYNKLGCLKHLNKLLDSLEIVIFLTDNASDAVYFENGELNKKKHIRKLTLKFSNSSMNAEIIEALQPPPNLENLVLHRYGGTKFPNWIASLNMLTVLNIRKSNMQSLPDLGRLPYLEILYIYDTGLEALSRDFLGITDQHSSVFPSLKRLTFESLEEWETWEDLREDEAASYVMMPCLRELNLYNCSRLEALPHCILSNASSSSDFTLSLKGCLLLLIRYSKLLGDEWKELSQIPNVVKDFD